MSVVVLSGGVGGAKLVDGLVRILPPDHLTVVVNTADDFMHLGLHISPDIDSVIYLLAGKSDPVRGWGVVDESWNFMSSLSAWGAEDWFNLGDRDLAMHVLRTRALKEGVGLTAFTATIAAAAGIRASILPMTENVVSTILHTPQGDLEFQHYFVKHRCEPAVLGISFAGANEARALPAALAALADPALEAIILAPSNPYLSIDPILAVPGLRDAIRNADAPVVAVSPIVGGQSVKGPTGKLMRELDLPVSNATVSAHYRDLINGLLIDSSDIDETLPLPVAALDTLMTGAADRARVARAALALARSLR